jgi:LSD1 subclass zinc finger protein
MSGRHRRDRQDPLHQQHVQDQVDAAAEESRQRLLSFYADSSTAPYVPVQGSPEDKIVVRVGDALQDGTGKMCGHLSSPQPVVVRAWDTPPVLRCHTCERALPYPGGVEEWRCDVCYSIEPDHSRFYSGSASIGAITVHFGLCSTCKPMSDPGR